MSAPTSLLRLQREFKAIVRSVGAEGIDEAARAAGIRGRAATYRIAYGIRLREALEEDFPATRAVLGAEAFAELARELVLRHPSRFASLAELGQGLPGYLAERAGRGVDPSARLDPPWLAELARLEWEQALSSIEPDEAPLELEALSALPGDAHGRIVLRLAASLRLLQSQWPIVALLSAALRGDASPLAGARPGASWIVVHRDGEDTAATEIPRAEWEVLELIRRGTPLGGLVAAFSGLPASGIQGCFSRWAAQGWITGFTLGEEGKP